MQLNEPDFRSYSRKLTIFSAKLNPMKKWMALPVLAITMASLLSSCVFVNGLIASNAGVKTQWQRTSDNTYVICDNLDTQFTYSFDYSGDLKLWDAALIGSPNTSVIVGDPSTTPTTSGVTYGTGNVVVTATILAKTTPQSLAAQSIVVGPPIPPAPKTFTQNRLVKLKLTVYNTQNQSGEFYYYDIPVGDCQ